MYFVGEKSSNIGLAHDCRQIVKNKIKIIKMVEVSMLFMLGSRKSFSLKYLGMEGTI
jgi:hypothetical protein